MSIILSISVAATLFAAGYFLHIIGKDRDMTADKQPPALPTISEDHGWIIQHFINQRWRLQAEVRECTDLAVLSDLWYEIDRLEWDFRDTIPDQLLIVHIDELFAFHAMRAQQLKKKLVTINN
jgi:hypothetical protein